MKWNDTPYTIYYPTEPGMYTINAVGPDGHSMGTSDVLVTEPMINNTGSTTNPWGSGAADDINGGGLLPGETPGGGDPGGGGGTPTESCDGCQIINDMLDCPEWDTYMGEWSKMIKNSVPPAPDWQQVANVMRDTIVPAIGNELLNKMPQYADIIADELQSREKAVSAPGQLPTFNPAVPTMTDLPSKFEQSVTDNVPSFEPDFSGSQPFVIPDPMTALDMSTDDKQGGYQHNPNPDRTAPTYTKTEAEPEPDIGYKEMPEVTVTPPAYQNRNTNSSTPAPGYKQANPTAAEPNRSYQITNSAPMPTYTDTNATSGSPMPAYRTKQ
ncbi:hypothetical protein [Paenibacillus validus]|uniref:hypothetical protein n=2 Tax=Paenibacillus validus TaxID=44253 RepID=UPI000FD92A49|nr:hypothetical protein [Paenibacillus validus]MED4605568.1 hypothetical protein [Paenibacillus validus]